MYRDMYPAGPGYIHARIHLRDEGATFTLAREDPLVTLGWAHAGGERERRGLGAPSMMGFSFSRASDALAREVAGEK